MNRRPLVAANWKMNGSRAANAAWVAEFTSQPVACDTVVCAPFVYLSQLVEGLAGCATEAGAQDMSEREPGAYTGDVAGEMLVDIRCRWVIVGHSERRALHGETDAIVAAKAARALALGLRPIVCVGETLAERDAGRTLEVVARQLDAVLACASVAELERGAIAYEPVWAIGTGRTATPAQAQQVHAAIRAQLAHADRDAASRVRILYGGSVKPSNAAELFAQADIDGGLIGGASLVARDFLAICAAAK
ncbi:MAG TPA: triose-phosphate isomerase [Burkholderiaceae bacterium]|jgi:triosephosphate isomerase|nr:triose-phosphate isomerase [Burkholderiaceae bacterium]